MFPYKKLDRDYTFLLIYKALLNSKSNYTAYPFIFILESNRVEVSMIYESVSWAR